MKAGSFRSFAQLHAAFPTADDEYQRLVALLDSLIERFGEDESHRWPH
jgi:hypothetical protein